MFVRVSTGQVSEHTNQFHTTEAAYTQGGNQVQVVQCDVFELLLDDDDSLG